MRDEHQWQPVDVIWDEDLRAPAQTSPLLWREPRLPLATPPPQERQRPERRAAERPERRDDHAESRRKGERPKRGRKKLRAHDFDDADDR